MRETIDIVRNEGGQVAGFVVAVDRMEKIPSKNEDDPGPSAMGQIRKEYGIPTASIVTLDDLIELLGGRGNGEDMKRMQEYRDRYRASD